jgi:division/cell wall cluster transcriptional repressor MraZ
MGQFEATRDERGRLAIPARLFYPFEHSAEVILGPAPTGDSLYIFPVATWEALVNRLHAARTEGDREAAAFLRFYTTLYRREKIQGGNHRIEIASHLARLAELGQTVMVVGRADRLQVFADTKWESFQAAVLADIRPLAEDSPYA